MKNRIFGNGNGQQQKKMRPLKEVPYTYIPNAKRALDYETYALRMIKRYGPFVSLGKQHWKWNGNIWKLTDFDQFRKQAVRLQPQGSRSCMVTDNILRMMTNLTQEDPSKIRWQGAVRFENKKRETVMISLLNGVLRVPLSSELAAANLVEPKQEDLVISELPVEYDPKAECPTFDYLLNSALPDERDRYLLQCYIGYCLLPDHRFQCALFCHGQPNSGKSLLIYHGVGSIFGAELMSHVSLESICAKGDELRKFNTSLVNLTTEIDSRQLKDSAIFNQVTCGEPIDAALKYEKTERIIPKPKIIPICNHPPHWERGSEAQARRIKFLHFSQDFTKAAKDGSLEKKVKLEANGIFNWALRGLLEVVKLNQIPDGSKASQLHAVQFNKHNNPLGTFNRSFCSFGVYKSVIVRDFRTAFKGWCGVEGISTRIIEPSQTLKKLYPELEIKNVRYANIVKKTILGMELNEKGKLLLAEICDNKHDISR